MCMCTLLRYFFLLFRYEKKYFLCFTFINFTLYSPFTFDISYYKVIVTNVLKYYVRCLTSQESNRREALNTLAKQNPVTILPAIPLPPVFLPTCKAKRVTYYVRGWPREWGGLLNTRLYILVVPSGALLYEYFNLINSTRASIDRYYWRSRAD